MSQRKDQQHSLYNHQPLVRLGIVSYPDLDICKSHQKKVHLARWPKCLEAGAVTVQNQPEKIGVLPTDSDTLCEYLM